ncbi:MAG: arginine--tRNA ligase [Candidatus Micrarchaeia archaeon]
MDTNPYKDIIVSLLDNISSVVFNIYNVAYTKEEILQTIEFSKKYGDLSSSISFRIAKELKKNPKEVSDKIKAELINKMEGIESISSEAGFLNINLNKEEFTRRVINYILDHKDKAIGSDIGHGKKVMIEYPSANPVHPLHIGQLRNAVIGDFLSRAFASCGYKVEREDYIDDLGLQPAQVFYAYMHSSKQPDEKFDHWLGNLYVEINKNMDEAKKAEIFDIVKAMEDSSSEEAKEARKISEECVKAHYETQMNYGIFHDVLVWESDIVHQNLLGDAINIMLNTGKIKKFETGEYAGCIGLDLNDVEELPEAFRGLKKSVKILTRSNGTATYVAKDIAFHMWKSGLIKNNFKYSVFMKQSNSQDLYTTGKEGNSMSFGGADKIINIIDSRQDYPQALLRLVFKIICRNDIAESIKHVSYGLVSLEDAALAGRKGNWKGNTADDLLEKAKEKAMGLITERFKFSEEEKEDVAKKIAISAIRFEFLRVAPEKAIIFKWSQALNFEGNSGPYCQYMHARASRLLEEAGSINLKEIKPELISEGVEFELVKKLAISSYVIEKACNEYRPNIVTDYLAELSSLFSKFYEQKSVLNADSEEQKMARLALTQAFEYISAGVLYVLGIEPASKM